MSTAEERRRAQIKAMEPGATDSTDLDNTIAGKDLDRLLDYFDEHEPAVASAIRYGLVDAGPPLSDGEPTYVIDKPDSEPS